ncbi:MAG TPA: HAMP domain-containing sensor histidine kinase [Rugosimonospora sp.]|nr:HAMP domain-containing sensor histidine kinase [Rugosimonospora sp.]
MRRLGRLGLRWRLGLVGTAAVAVVVALVALLGYVAVRRDLVSDVDNQLRMAYRGSQRRAGHHLDEPGPGPGLAPRGGGMLVQFVAADGTVANAPADGVPLPVDARTRAVAAGTRDSFLSDVDSGGTHLRVLTGPARSGGAVQVALPMSAVDGELSRLEAMLVWVGLGGLLVAAALNWLVGRAVLGPVGRLTRASERVSSTMDLSGRIEAAGPDELRRLAHSFNAMLDAVSEAVDAQRQLVADASHELRTPLTSLRTNVELLARAERMPPADRARLVSRVDAGLAELGGLVNDIVDLARGEEPEALVTYLNLDALVREAVGRAGDHWPEITFAAELDPVLVRGVADRVARAVANLLDNAAKFSPPDGQVEVSLGEFEDGALLTVRDHGTGVAEADLERVFDRFYRAPEARRVPGAGLGLAIVGQVARSHDGWARLEPAAGGGTRALLWFPAASGTG